MANANALAPPIARADSEPLAAEENMDDSREQVSQVTTMGSRSNKRQRANDSEDEDSEVYSDLLAEEEANAEETATQKKHRRAMNFFQTRMEDRRAHRKPQVEREPRHILDEAILEHWDNKEYRESLKALPRDKPTAEQVEKLKRAELRSPNYLGRTASRTVGRNFKKVKQPSNGFTSRDLLMPAADTKRDYGLNAQLTDLDQGEAAYDIGQHLVWNDPRGDQFLSYSIDLAFLLHHALNRYHEGQREVTVQYVDRRKASNAYGKPAAFYHALDLYEIYNVPGTKIWKGQSVTKLYPRKFTQEYLTHGTITVSDNRIKPAPIERLVEKGLFVLFPELKVGNDHERAGLYEGQVAYRKIGFPPGNVNVQRHPRIYSYTKCARTVPITVELLTLVQKITRCFMVDKTAEPLLHIFLHFLTLHKRPKGDPVFMEWIRTHYTGKYFIMIVRYTLTNLTVAQDVMDVYDDGAGEVQLDFTRVANNLPGVMQYLDLIRDAIAVFDLRPLPANLVEKHNPLTMQDYADDDARLNRTVKLGKWYDEDAQKDQREKAKQRRETKKKEEEERMKVAAAQKLADIKAGDADEELNSEIGSIGDIHESNGSSRLLVGEEDSEDDMDALAITDIMDGMDATVDNST